jgi:alpha-tubulin suppressor-like RCC1 family protein
MKRKVVTFRNGMILLLLCGTFLLMSCDDDDGSNPQPILSAPTDLSASPGSGQATLQWKEVGTATAYNLYSATEQGVTKENFSGLSGGNRQTGVTPPFTQTGLVNGTTYYFVVTAEGALGESEESPEVRITPSPPAPVEVVDAGGTHTVALKTTGMVWTWGGNESGQLGDGTTTRRLAPVQVNGLTGITAIAAGTDHTLALKEDGTVWAWGENSFGQLGDGTKTDALFPVQVSGLTDVIAIAGGRNHSIALVERFVGSSRVSEVWTWGDNSSGQLGIGSSTGPELCGDPPLTAPCSTIPVEVGGLPDPLTPTAFLISVAAGAFHSVALTDALTDGKVWIWGDNRHRQFDNTGQNLLVPGAVPGITQPGFPPSFPPLKVIGIAAGAFHTVALRDDDTFWTWGSNGSGQLGDGTTNDRSAPAIVTLPTTPPTNLTGVEAGSAGGGHTVVARLDGTVMAWGDHLFGREIDGTTIKRLTPAPVSGLTDIIQVASGGFHAAALKADGSVWTWGDNFAGQLGNGTTRDLFTPVQVLGPNS